MCSKYFQLFWFLIITPSLIFFGCTSDESYDNKGFVSEVNTLLSEIPFVIVGGNAGANGDHNVILSSNDGITWENISLSSLTFNTDPTFKDVVYGDQFLIVGSSGTVLYTTDSISWNNVSLQSPLNYNWENITYGNSTYLASSPNNGSTTGKLMYSTNGTSWTDINTGLSASESIQGVTYCLDKFIYWIGSSTYSTSSNGINWGSPLSGPGPINSVKLHCINDIFVVAGDPQSSGHVFFSSNDLSSLSSLRLNGDLSETQTIVKGIAYGNNKYVAIIQTMNNGFELRYSSNFNSSNWTKITTSLSSMNDITFRNNKFIIVGGGGQIKYSFDGTNWLTGNSGTTSTLNSIY